MTTVSVTFRLRGGCKEAWDAIDPAILVEGPRGTGKSRTLLEKEYAFCQKYPGMRTLIVRKTLRSIAGSVAQTMRQQVITNGDGVSFFGGNEIEPAAFRFKNGSAIVLAGLDDTEKLKSSEFFRIYWNEATEGTEDDLESLKALLRQDLPSVPVPRQLTLDCNPDSAGHWLNQMAERGEIRRIKTKLPDNPWLYNEDGTMTPNGEAYINGILETYRGPRRQRWLEGQWTGTENAVYAMFDPAVHVRPLEPGLYFKATVIGVDYGATHKCSVVALSIDQFNRRWVREVWGEPDKDEGRSLNLTIAQFKERYRTRRGRGDPNQRYLNEQHGFSTARAGNGARQHRIDLAEPLFYSYPGGRVPSFNESRRLGVPQGPFAEPDSVGLFLVEGAPGVDALARELESYHYVIKDTERGKVKEVFRLDDDHVAGFEYANEEWEETGNTSYPTAVPQLGRVAPPPVTNSLLSRRKRDSFREWKLH